MIRWLLILLVLVPSGAVAETPLSAGAFERLVTGRTLTYSRGGVAFGVEDYLSDRRVRWSFLDGTCQEGRWYEAGDLICFVYEEIPTPQCWSFFLDGGALSARFENDPAAQEVYRTSVAPEPLHCPGPRVGV